MMNIFSGKRGYFFIFDALVAMTIFSVGLFVLLSSFSKIPPRSQVVITSDDILDFLTGTSIKSYVDEENVLNKTELIQTGSLDNSIIEQVMEFRYLGEDQKAEDLLRTSLSRIVPVQINFRVVLDGSILYQRSIIEAHEADLLIPSRIYGVAIYNQTEIVGPSLTEVDVWQ